MDCQGGLVPVLLTQCPAAVGTGHRRSLMTILETAQQWPSGEGLEEGTGPAGLGPLVWEFSHWSLQTPVVLMLV